MNRRRFNQNRYPMSGKLNASEDTLTGDDADFVKDVESVILDENGNEVEVSRMLVVQDSETREISLFIPTTPEETVPETLHVIGTVTAATESSDLDSGRHSLVAGSRPFRRRFERRLNSSARSWTLGMLTAVLLNSILWVYDTSGEFLDSFSDMDAVLGDDLDFFTGLTEAQFQRAGQQAMKLARQIISKYEDDPEETVLWYTGSRGYVDPLTVWKYINRTYGLNLV